MGQCSVISPDAAWAEADELRVAERPTFESNIYVQPKEAAESVCWLWKLCNSCQLDHVVAA